MALHERFPGLVGSPVPPWRRPLKGMAFLHEDNAAVKALGDIRPRMQARDLIALLLRHFTERRRPVVPRCLIRLDVATPSGKAAVKILGANRLATPAPDTEALRAQG